MKLLFKIAFCLFAGLCICTACKDSEETISGFTLDKENVTLGAEGGTENVQIKAGSKWVAKADQPWLQVLPANGVGSTECKIVVDSTLRNDIRKAVITFVPEGMAPQKLEVRQTGFGKMIGLDVEEVKVPNMGKYGERYFDVTVTTNVDFNVDIATDAEKQGWLVKPKYTVDLNYGARPRTTKLRFQWSMNTDPKERLATVKFTPSKEADAEAKIAALKVVQEAAPLIEQNRAGDSLSLIIMQEKMNGMTKWNTSEKMEYWIGVKLWEKKDDAVKKNPAMLGRVRSAEIRMISTQESLPDEVANLKFAESLTFASNTNTMLLTDLSVGTAICQLENLKSLTVYGYGIDKLPDEFVNLKNLEVLNLTGNNFNDVPNILTPTNFPNLVSLNLSSQRRYTITNLQTETRPNPGLMIAANSTSFLNLLKWEKLTTLRLSYNLIYGSLPATVSGVPYYTDEDAAQNDTLKTAIQTLKEKRIQKILPNVRVFSVNLNFMTGTIPNWIKYHPNFGLWAPFTFIFPQSEGYNNYGQVTGFTSSSVPANLDEYYELYPLRKPKPVE